MNTIFEWHQSQDEVIKRLKQITLGKLHNFQNGTSGRAVYKEAFGPNKAGLFGLYLQVKN